MPRTILTVAQRKELIQFRHEYPDFSHRKMAVFFAEKWNIKINRGHIERALKNSEKLLDLSENLQKVKRLPKGTGVGNSTPSFFYTRRILHQKTLTRRQAPQTPRTFPVRPNSNPNP